MGVSPVVWWLAERLAVVGYVIIVVLDSFYGRGTMRLYDFMTAQTDGEVYSGGGGGGGEKLSWCKY